MADADNAPAVSPAAANDDNASGDHKGIKEVAAMLGVTHRTLRFYEDNGLISPQRVGSTRIYSKRDIGRMQLILRGKRLGFSLREIGEFLDLYDSDPSHIEQMEHLRGQVREKLAELRAQKAALEETMRELRQIEAEATDRIEARR
ncbi:MerR family transcriptional regulator [Alteraurantiacibacter aquimixticola]|uniref:MerR family DNA-binding transcriptional regulator n=1 Tax=Alteraurantiacibacter aquimixticola TaxID=2489173 RepID=A0A4T3F0V9_9SPHN|nr:MerR family DNA-binding transcriptional regulator [Alteraurantiacibacter aquimixticola]TIX50682.1 MerR family DNA-binding transcriptional regulator [Alteraurantiacibacter aquimixticola]